MSSESKKRTRSPVSWLGICLCVGSMGCWILYAYLAGEMLQGAIEAGRTTLTIAGLGADIWHIISLGLLVTAGITLIVNMLRNEALRAKYYLLSSIAISAGLQFLLV